MTPSSESYREIVTQKAAWEEAVQVAGQKKAEILEFFDILKPSELFFLGCTSPYYLGLAAAAYWRMHSSLPARSIPSSDLALYPDLYYPGPLGNPVLIALSRSGKTTETTWAAEEFGKRYPGRTALIGCNPSGALADMVKLKLILPESAENTVPQTRSFASMLLAALLMAAYYSGDAEQIAALQQAPERVERIVQTGISSAHQLGRGKTFHNIFVLGSGPLYPIALEVGLKCMEMSNTDAFSYPFLESRHGPRALIDENSLVIGLFSRGGLHYEAQVMEEYTLRHKATTVAIVPQAGWETGPVSVEARVDCAWPDETIGLCYLPVGQLIAHALGVSKGLDPDRARFHSTFVEIKRF